MILFTLKGHGKTIAENIEAKRRVTATKKLTELEEQKNNLTLSITELEMDNKKNSQHRGHSATTVWHV